MPIDELLDSAPCGYLTFDDDGVILACNATARAMLEYGAGELEGRRLEALLSPGGRIFYQTHVFPLLKLDGQIEEIYISLRTRSGAEMPVLLNAARRLRAGQLANECVIVRMHQRRRYESELLQSKRLAEEAMHAEALARAALAAERQQLAQRVEIRTADLNAANAELARAARLKDEFLATMSHELRTPLNAVLGIVEALLEQSYGPQNDDQLRALRHVGGAGRHLLEIINDILDYARIGAGQFDMTIAPVEVAPICQASLRAIGPAAEQKQIAVQLSCDPAAQQVLADPRRLKQILANLLSNAIKFTPAGGAIGIDASADRERQAVQITVWDTGIGIAPEDLPKLFRPFEQLDGRLARRFEGTGLGLALVQRMAELHGGSVSLTSAPGQGSRFTVSLPIASDWAAPRADAAGASGGAPAQPMIVLADDCEACLQLIGGQLDAAGYRVVLARDGAEALSRAREAVPALILIDTQMPGIDGLEVTRRIRADAALRGVPIVAITTQDLPGDRERILRAGADAYLVKPAHPRALLATIDAQLHQHLAAAVGE